jgi:hypothetical protein
VRIVTIGRRHVWSLALALVFLAVATWGTSRAGHYDNIYPTENYQQLCTDGEPGDGFCLTDNRSLVVNLRDNLSATGKGNIRETLNGSYDNTVLNVGYTNDPVYAGDNETDIVYIHKPDAVPAGKVGRAWCNDAVTIRLCDQAYAAFEFDTPDRALACHETGHDVGLTHGAQAAPTVPNGSSSLHCMKDPDRDTYLGTHNVNQIDAVY